MRSKIDLTTLTPREFRHYYSDWYEALIRKAFNAEEILVLVSYQPDVITLDHNQVLADTNLLFHNYTYIEVVERNNSKKRMYNDANYADGYHAHLIMKESDYNTIEQELDGLDIVAKPVYDLDGLTGYLVKQAADMYPRLLPMLHRPIKVTVPEVIQARVIKILKKQIIFVNLKVCTAISTIKIFIIKPVQKISKKKTRLMAVADTS